LNSLADTLVDTLAGSWPGRMHVLRDSGLGS